MTMYLNTDSVQMLNEEFVGAGMLRDFGLLESAVMRPQASAYGEDAYPTLHEKSAALLHSLARNHPFIDANKRTAWAATDVFYRINGYELSVQHGAVVGLMVDVAEGQLDVPNIAALLKSWALPISGHDDWMDEPPRSPEKPVETAEEQATDAESEMQGFEAMYAHAALTEALGDFVTQMHEFEVSLLELESLGCEVPDEQLEQIRRMRQRLIDSEVPQDWLDAQPLFARLLGEKERHQRKSKAPRTRKKRRRR